MARAVFSRSGNKSAARTLSVSTEGVVRRVLADPGEYLATVKTARLIEPRHNGNVSVVLELIDPENGEFYDVRPLWVAGPNAGNGNMAGRNLGIIRDLLEVIGTPASSYRALDDELLGRLVGRIFELTLDVDRGNQGGMFNIIAIVHRAVDPGDVVQFPAAD